MSKGKTIFYRRVSTAQQSFSRQEIPGIQFDKIYEEKASGKRADDRAALQAMLDYIRDDDHVYVYDLTRLGRSMIDVDKIIQKILEKGAKITFFKEKIEVSGDDEDPFKRLQRQLLASFAEFERNIIRQRINEGIDRAKAAGTWHLKMTDDKVSEMQRLLGLGLSITKVAKAIGVSRGTIYNTVAAQKAHDAAFSASF